VLLAVLASERCGYDVHIQSGSVNGIMAASKKKKSPKEENNYFSSALKGKTGWIVALVFVSAWMFFLGILVGRGTIPVVFKSDKLQQELAELKDADTQALLNRVEINADTQKTKKDLDFYEKLKQPKAAPRISPKTQPKVSANKKIKTAPTPKARPSKKEATQTPPSVKKTPKTAKSSPPAAVGERNLAIQVGAFRGAEEADKMVTLLKNKGYPAFKETGIVAGRGIWYRVRVGYYADRNETARVMDRLKKDGQKGFVVTK
jgi:cell division septation protein DedD